MKHGARRAVAQPAAEDPGLWRQVVPQMLVEKFPETAIAQAARVVILAGKSIVESELGGGLASGTFWCARRCGCSRARD
jgi:hypothetical protein